MFDVCQLTKDSTKQHQHSPTKSLQFRSIGEGIHSIKGLAFILMSPVYRTLSLSITSLTSNINGMEEFICIFCSEIVTSRQETLLCGGCDNGQYRRCYTGVDRETYRQAVRDGQDISWTCLYCTVLYCTVLIMRQVATSDDLWRCPSFRTRQLKPLLRV